MLLETHTETTFLLDSIKDRSTEILLQEDSNKQINEKQ